MAQNNSRDEEVIDPETGEAIEPEVKDLMDNHDIDKDTAERVKDLVDEGLYEEDAVSIDELLN